VRAAPLAAIGWFPTESITEDFLLSLKLTASGWHCRCHYNPVPDPDLDPKPKPSLSLSISISLRLT